MGEGEGMGEECREGWWGMGGLRGLLGGAMGKVGEGRKGGCREDKWEWCGSI